LTDVLESNLARTISLPVVSHMKTEKAPESDGTKIYAPRLSVQFRFGFILLCLSLFGLFPSKAILDWHAGGAVPNAKTILAFVSFLVLPVCLLLGLVINVLRGLPRLTIGRDGVTIKSAFGTQWANWDSITPFTIQAMDAGKLRKPILKMTAKVIGTNANRFSRRAKMFSVPNAFQGSVENIVADLNATRSRAVGGIETLVIPEPSEAPIGLIGFGLPWLTFALLTVLVAIFVMENLFAITPSVKSTPSLPTLVAFGALNWKAIVAGGQWYRLFTAPLLHANVAHLVGNGLALLMGGWLLERLIGRLWFFALFFVSALGGSLLSLAVGSSNLVSVGASGAIMGLFAALFLSSFRLASGTQARTRMQVYSARVLVPSLIPLFSASSIQIDYGAHFGGAISGAAVALVLLRFWPETARIPQLRKVAAAISIVGVFLFVAGECVVLADYPAYRSLILLTHSQIY
jgi:membrane associated rhomboid family serine protease